MSHAARARCDGCAWSSTAANAMGKAAQHHDRTGHVVHVDYVRHVKRGTVTVTALYDAQRAPLPGQTTLELEEPAA